MARSFLIRQVISLFFTAHLIVWGTAIGAVDDVTRGVEVFKKCASCHMVGPSAKKRSGLPLNDLINSPAGRFDGFKYSESLLAAARDGLIWDIENLDRYLENPKKFIPKTKMSFRGLRKADDRSDVISYLASFSNDAATKDVVVGFTVSADILAIEGDVEYGKYLAGECTTCHQSSGNDDGIPTIQGLETEPFVTALHAYRSKYRDNSVMQLVAGRLTDEEIAALAAYFRTLIIKVK